jgi:hypothetical protein
MSEAFFSTLSPMLTGHRNWLMRCRLRIQEGVADPSYGALGTARELGRACDMHVVAFRPGSLRVGLRLPEQPEVEFTASREKSLGHQALVTYLDVATWVSSEGDLPDPAQQIEDAQERRLLLNTLKPLVPRPRGDVEGVEISSRLIPDGRTIRLTRAVYHCLIQAVDRPAAMG